MDKLWAAVAAGVVMAGAGVCYWQKLLDQQQAVALITVAFTLLGIGVVKGQQVIKAEQQQLKAGQAELHAEVKSIKGSGDGAA